MRLSRFKFIQQLLTLLLLIPLLSPPSSINVSAQVIDTGKQRETIAQRNPEKRGSSNSIIVKYKAGQSPKDIRKQVTERQVQSSSILGKMSLSLKNMQYQISGQNTPEVKLAEIDEIKVSNNLIEKPVFEKYEKQVRGVYTYTKPQNTQNVDAIIAQYEGLEEVEYAEVDEYSYATSTPQDEFYYKQWGMDMINAPQAWDISKGDSSGSMFIAIIDSGIAWDHPDLNSKIMAVYDKCDADPLDTRFDCRYQDGYDRDTHGTHVSGIAAAEVENDYYNGKYLGVAGAGYNTKIISIKALDNYGSGLTTWLASSLYGLANTFPGKKIVVNMSIAVNGSSQTLQDAIAAAHNAGFVLVAAAGNGDASGNGVSTLTYPAAYPDVIAVGALNRAGNKTGYSNFGANWVDVAAPGGDCSSYATRGDCILSTTSYDTVTQTSYFNYYAGTSMASPHVAGIAALVWAQSPSFTNSQVENAIFNSARANSGTGTYWKYGTLDAAAALAPPAPTNTPIPTATLIPTNTPAPTNTPIPTATFTPIPPTPTNTPTPIPTIQILPITGSIYDSDTDQTVPQSVFLNQPVNFLFNTPDRCYEEGVVNFLSASDNGITWTDSQSATFMDDADPQEARDSFATNPTNGKKYIRIECRKGSEVLARGQTEIQLYNPVSTKAETVIAYPELGSTQLWCGASGEAAETACITTPYDTTKARLVSGNKYYLQMTDKYRHIEKAKLLVVPSGGIPLLYDASVIGVLGGNGAKTDLESFFYNPGETKIQFLFNNEADGNNTDLRPNDISNASEAYTINVIDDEISSSFVFNPINNQGVIGQTVQASIIIPLGTRGKLLEDSTELSTSCIVIADQQNIQCSARFVPSTSSTRISLVLFPEESPENFLRMITFYQAIAPTNTPVPTVTSAPTNIPTPTATLNPTYTPSPTNAPPRLFNLDISPASPPRGRRASISVYSQDPENSDLTGKIDFIAPDHNTLSLEMTAEKQQDGSWKLLKNIQPVQDGRYTFVITSTDFEGNASTLHGSFSTSEPGDFTTRIVTAAEYMATENLVDITLTVSNTGVAPLNQSIVEVFLDPTLPIDSTLQPIITFPVDSLDITPPGNPFMFVRADYHVSLGAHTFCAIINRSKDVIEQSYDNNTACTTVSAPTNTPPAPSTIIGSPTPTPESCPLLSSGDATCDGNINSEDYVRWLNEYFCAIDKQDNCSSAADFDKDGVTNLFDFTIWLVGIRSISTN